MAHPGGPRDTFDDNAIPGCAEQFPGGGIVMLWTIFVVLAILWLLGFSLHIGGGLIHLLLLVALIVLVINLLSGRRGLA